MLIVWSIPYFNSYPLLLNLSIYLSIYLIGILAILCVFVCVCVCVCVFVFVFVFVCVCVCVCVGVGMGMADNCLNW